MISIPATPAVTPYWFELLVDASERSSVERFGHTSNDCEPLSRDGYGGRIPNPSTWQVSVNRVLLSFLRCCGDGVESQESSWVTHYVELGIDEAIL